MKHLFLSLCSSLSAALLLTGCTDDLGYRNNGGNGDSSIKIAVSLHNISTDGSNTRSHSVTPLDGFSTPLYLHAFGRPTVDKPQTRGTRTTEIDKFCLYGYAIANKETTNNIGGTEDAEGTRRIYFQGDEISKDNTSTGRYWPHPDYNMEFYAFYNDDGGEVNFGEYEENTPIKENPSNTTDVVWVQPSIGYTVKEDVSEQSDLIGMAVLTSQNSGTVILPFYHLLSEVNFNVAQDFNGKVKNIVLDNLYDTGTGKLVAATGGSNPVKWENLSGNASYTIEETDGSNFDEKDNTGNVSGSGYPLTNSGNNLSLYLMPQQLSEKGIDNSDKGDVGGNEDNDKEEGSGKVMPTVTVTFEDEKTLTATLTATLTGEWLPGYSYTYVISGSKDNPYLDPIFVVEGPNGSIPCAGGSSSYSVKSYDGESYEAINWELVNIEYIDYKGETVENKWFSSIDIGIPQQGGENEIQFTVDKNTAKLDEGDQDLIEGNLVLKNASPKGSKESPHDLSLDYNGSVNTANCYIVNAAGFYSLPLVYGNGIKDGMPNTAAFERDGFVNHLGNHITAAYIKDNGIVPDDAVLVWQDAMGVISNVWLDNDKLCFEVDQKKIKQCNAIVAVRDKDDNIIWSWHIWITDYDGRSTITVSKKNSKYESENVTYHFMPQALGACEGKSQIEHPSRSAVLTFRQSGTGKEQKITIKQDAEVTATEYGSFVNYEWGRKDPLCPADYNHEGKQISEDGLLRFDSDFKPLYFSKYEYAYYGTKDGIKNCSCGNPHSYDYVRYNECANYNPDVNYSVQEGILHPYSFYKKEFNNSQKSYFWNADESMTRSTKTVYDPCPVGFKVPCPKAFTPFFVNSAITDIMDKLTNNGAIDGINISDLNGDYHENVKAFSLKCYSEDGSIIEYPEIVFVCTGQNTGDTNTDQDNAYYWGATQKDENGSIWFSFDNVKESIQLTMMNKTNACAIRPVLESDD